MTFRELYYSCTNAMEHLEIKLNALKDCDIVSTLTSLLLAWGFYKLICWWGDRDERIETAQRLARLKKNREKIEEV